MLTSTLTASFYRLISIVLILSIPVGDWLYEQTNPNVNAKFWVAGFGGALMLRALLPGLTWRKHLLGLLVGTGSAIFWATDVHNMSWFSGLSEFGVWAGVGLAGDIGGQIVALLLQLLLKLATYAFEKPQDALNDGLNNGGKIVDFTVDKGGKFLEFWSRMKAPLLDAVHTIFGKDKPPTP